MNPKQFNNQHFLGIWDFGNPAESETRFRELLDDRTVASDPSVMAEVLTQISRAQGLQGNFEAAHATLDDIDPAVVDSAPVVRTRLSLERGRLLNSSRKNQEAVPYFLVAFTVANENDLDYLAVDAAHMMGIASPPEDQKRWTERAIRLAEESADPLTNRWLGSLYNNLGWTFHDLGDFPSALDTFNTALKWQEKFGDRIKIGIAEWTVARTLRSMGRFAEALAMQQRLRSKNERDGTEDGYVYEEIGECLLSLSRELDAAEYFRKAYELLSSDSYLATHESDRLARIRALGNADTRTPPAE